MTPLPEVLLKVKRTGKFVAWRLDKDRYAATWDQGIGPQKVGGRWNPVGLSVIYTSLDPATAILEVAVHAGFEALDCVAHKLIKIEVAAKNVHVVQPADVPNPNWLQPGNPSAGQQAFGKTLIEKYPLVLIPSVVSRNSWNLLINPTTATGAFSELSQESFGLDGRLNPPKKP